LAGYLFGNHELNSKLKIGDEVRIADAAGLDDGEEKLVQRSCNAFDCGMAA
jgi:hypothetical protein